jgi:hypothetical protein
MASPYVVKQRLTAVLVLGILHLVGGGLGLIVGLCGIVGQMFKQGMAAMISAIPDPNGELPTGMITELLSIPEEQAVAWTDLVLGIVLSVLLIVAGIGLLSTRPWARILSLVYAPLSILDHVGFIVGTLLFVQPARQAVLEKYARNNPGLMPAGASDRIGPVLEVFWAAVLLIYPIVVLVILNLGSVKAAFRGEKGAPGPALPEDEGWGPIKRPGLSTDVTTERERDRFQPPGS